MTSVMLIGTRPIVGGKVQLDKGGREIDALIGGPPSAPEWFSQGLPDPRYRYHWTAYGSYRNVFPSVQGMRMYSSC